MAENYKKKKKHHFSLFKGNISYMESSDNFDPLDKPNGFGDICKKVLPDHYVLFLVMTAMFL